MTKNPGLSQNESQVTPFCLELEWAPTAQCPLTDVKTSVVCWMVAIFFQPHFSKSFTRVGLCRVADG